MITTTIHISDILKSQRMDVSYFKDKLGHVDFVPLSKYVDIKGGKRIPKGKTFSSDKTNYLYLRLSDITDYECIDYNALKNISEDLFNILKRYEIRNDQIVFSIAGTIGRVFVIKNIPEDKRIVLTENCARLLPKTGMILSEYVAIMLNCDFVQKQIEQNRIQTTIPKIGLDRIAKLKIPEMPTSVIQQKIVDIYSKAQDERWKKNVEAQQLFNAIDDYLLNVLQIENTFSTKKHKIYIKQKVSSIIGGRFDPKSVLYLGEFAKSIKYENVQLKKIAKIEKGTSITGDEVNKKGKYPVIAGGQRSPYNHDKYNYDGDVITVSASGAYSGYVWYHSNPIFASDCSVIFSANNQFLTQYLFEVLKAQQSHIYMLQQGAGQPHVYPNDLGKLWIPVVPLSKQKEIVEHIMAIRQRAKILQEEGNALLVEAKQKIEELILA